MLSETIKVMWGEDDEAFLLSGDERSFGSVHRRIPWAACRSAPLQIEARIKMLLRAFECWASIAGRVSVCSGYYCFVRPWIANNGRGIEFSQCHTKLEFQSFSQRGWKTWRPGRDGQLFLRRERGLISGPRGDASDRGRRAWAVEAASPLYSVLGEM